MTYTIGLATTFHDPALAIIGPDGEVVFAEATERYLQYKRAPNCEPDPVQRMEGLLKRYIPGDAEVRIATSWSEDFTGFLDQMSRAGSFSLDALLKLSPELNRSLVPERTERALIAALHLGQQRAGLGTLLGLDRAFGKSNVTGLTRYDHHLSHAAYACWSSPFTDAACLIVDGMGETGASAIFALADGKITEVKRHRGRESIGFYFGLVTDLAGFDQAKGEEWKIMGLALHIGSQIRETDSFETAYAKMATLVRSLRGEGHRVERLDLGGGLGIPYEIPKDFDYGPDLIEAYAAMVGRVTKGLDVELGFEPGRLIVGNAGILLTRVLYLNPRPTKQFLVVDAAMNDLMRPAMYEAYHEIWPVSEPATDASRIAYDVVGPICESGDTFTTGRILPEQKPDDLIAFMTAGAYGASMSSTYNQRLLVPEVLVKGGQFAVTRPRQSYEELLGTDRAPPWLA